MGGIFFLSLVAQVITLGKWYLATIEFFTCSIIQLCLSGYVFVLEKTKNIDNCIN